MKRPKNKPRRKPITKAEIRDKRLTSVKLLVLYCNRQGKPKRWTGVMPKLDEFKARAQRGEIPDIMEIKALFSMAPDGLRVTPWPPHITIDPNLAHACGFPVEKVGDEWRGIL